MLGNLPLVTNPVNAMVEASRRFGEVTYFRLGPPLFSAKAVLVRHPELIKYVLLENRDNYIKGLSNDYLKGLLGHGLLTSEGETWTKQRKMVQRLFYREALQQQVGSINRCIDRRIDRWSKFEETGDSFDMADEMLHLTLEIAGEVLFRFDLRHESETVSDRLKFLEDDVMLRIRTPMTPPRWVPTPHNRRFYREKECLHDVVDRIIEHVRTTAEGKEGLLAAMILGRSDRSQLRDEIMTLLLASHETTASALTWTWYLLSENPEFGQRMHDEAVSVLDGENPRAEDVDRLEYAQQCFFEAMRLFPPGWSLERRAVADDTIGGFEVKARDLVLCSAYVAHRNPAYWPDPTRFDPARFTPDKIRAMPQFTYFPFGGGVRQCVGSELAIMQAKLILARLSERWRPEMVPGHPVDTDPKITLRAKFGMAMVMKDHG